MPLSPGDVDGWMGEGKRRRWNGRNVRVESRESRRGRREWDKGTSTRKYETKEMHYNWHMRSGRRKKTKSEERNWCKERISQRHANIK